MFSFTLSPRYCRWSCCPIRRLPWSYPKSSKFSLDRVIVTSDKVWRSSLLLAWIIPVSEEYHCLPCRWNCNRMTQWATAISGHQFEYDCDSITRSAILVLLQTQKIASSQTFGFERIQLFTGQNSPYSKVFGFKVPTLNFGFKISGGMAKPGRFYFRFVHLCVNGKTNPVLTKRSLIRLESETIYSSVNLVDKGTYISGHNAKHPILRQHLAFC